MHHLTAITKLSRGRMVKSVTGKHFARCQSSRMNRYISPKCKLLKHPRGTRVVSILSPVNGRVQSIPVRRAGWRQQSHSCLMNWIKTLNGSVASGDRHKSVPHSSHSKGSMTSGLAGRRGRALLHACQKLSQGPTASIVLAVLKDDNPYQCEKSVYMLRSDWEAILLVLL